MNSKPSYEELLDRVHRLEKEVETHRRIEAELKTSEERFRDIANNALEWIWEIDSTGRYIYSSPVVKEILGYEPHEVLGKYFYDFFHPDDKKRLMGLASKAIAQKRAFRKFINRNVDHNGKLVVLSTSAVPLMNEEGMLVGYRGADTDITEPYYALKELRESKENLRSLLKSASGFAIYQLIYDKRDPQSLRVVFVSRSFKDILGISEPMKFEEWFDHVHPDDVGRIARANKQAFEIGRFNEVYRWYNPEKQTWLWIHAISTAGAEAENGNMYVNGILIDVTDKQQAFEKLKTREEDLEYKTKDLEQMNAALNILLKKRNQDKLDFQESIGANVKLLILPYLERIRKRNLENEQSVLLDIIRTNLNEITESFAHKLTSKYIGLTATEIRVADLVKQGQKTKQIAQILYLSPKTVESHRENIRKKLGIKNKKINLQSYLLSVE